MERGVMQMSGRQIEGTEEAGASVSGRIHRRWGGVLFWRCRLWAWLGWWRPSRVASARTQASFPSALIGKLVPEFDLPPVLGRTAGLASADLRGQVSLVNVFE